MTSRDLGVKLTPLLPFVTFRHKSQNPLPKWRHMLTTPPPAKLWLLLSEPVAFDKSTLIGLQSIGLMHQFHIQHYSHPAVDCRVVFFFFQEGANSDVEQYRTTVIPAMTITDSTHHAATGQLCESQRVLYNVTTLNPPPPPSSRIVTLVW